MSSHVNHQAKWVFIHVPKTGGTSMERALNINQTVHMRADVQRTRYPDFLLWGFVRHPCDRILSAYFYECRAERKQTSLSGLRDYVDSPPQKVHTVPQVHFTHSEGGVVLDFLGRFESINSDFAAVCDHLDMPRVALPIANKTSHPPWIELFDTSMMRRTRRNFPADFEQFGYDPFTPANVDSEES